MIRPLKKTSKFYASTRKEADDHIEKMIKETPGVVVNQKVIQKEHKEAGTYYEFEVTEELNRSKDILDNGFLSQKGVGTKMKKLSKKEIESTGIKVKNPIRQFLCKHQNKSTFVVNRGKFYSLHGDRHVTICKDCGLETGTYFAQYEGSGHK